MSTNETRTTDQGRRKFLGSSAVVAGAALAPGVMLSRISDARPADQPVNSEVRWGMLVDTTRCADGCTACVEACDRENGLDRGDERHSRPSQQAQWIRSVELRNKATGHRTTLPLMCQHCENPPCVDVCPTGASFKRADGIVLVDKHICIGCRYCMMACPYKARSFIHEELTNQLPDVPRGKGTVESCTMCVHRIDAGELPPACVEACNTEGSKAIWFGDLRDPNSEISQQLQRYPSTQLRADLNLNTGIRYRGI